MSKIGNYQKVETWNDNIKQEHNILNFWEEKQIFKKLIKQNENSPIFSFLDGPITANNPMGVHHAWGRSLKDAFQRYHAMNGKKLRYQNGFDCQGLWVEIEVEKELGFSSKKDILEYGIDKFVQACKDRVKKYSDIQTKQSIRLGMWMDWKNSYFTMAEENNYTIWSFLKKCHEQGKIYRGTDVMPWSGRSGSAYSQMEVIEGRKFVAHTSLFVKFPLIDLPNHNLLVWTTTPWTLSSNIAAAVNADLDYIKLKSNKDGQIYIFAKDNLEFKRLDKQYREKNWIDGVPKLKTLAQIFNEHGGYEIIDTIKGNELIGLKYKGPFDELEATQIPGGFPFTDENVPLSAAQAHQVIDGGCDSHGSPVVVAGEGTGIVHIAPGCGDIDHKLGVKHKLPMIAPLDETAKFLPPFGFLANKPAIHPDTNQLIIDSLKQKNLLLAQELYPHIYPHCWRSGEELVFRMVDEWYINMDWRDKIIKIVDDIQWIPDFGKDREIEWLTNMHDWMISKKRYWGLALPIWVCEKCQHFDVIGSKEELKTRATQGWEQFEGHTPHKPWIDAVKLTCPHCKGTQHRIEDVGNPWLDAGIVPYSTVKYNSDKEYWKQWIPANLVLECFPGQFRNWFYSLLAMSTMMENIAPFKTLLGHALVHDENGQPMHKSTGNAIWFDDAAEQAGADVMRWLYARQNTEVNLNFGFNILRAIRGGFINTIWNTYAFFINYARLENWIPPKTPTPFKERSLFDQWILSETQVLIEKTRQSFESYNIRQAALAIEDFVEQLSNWYLRHNRKRFWKIETPDNEKSQAAFETLFDCLLTLTKLIAPIMPFLAETIYQNLAINALEDAKESVHLDTYPCSNPNFLDQQLKDDMQDVMTLTKIALAARDSQKLKLRQPLAKLTISTNTEQMKNAAIRFADILKEDLNVKELQILPPDSPSPIQYKIKPNFKNLSQKYPQYIKNITAELNKPQPEWLSSLKKNKDFTLKLNDNELILSPSDFILEPIPNDNIAAAEENNTWVAFDTNITEELKIEGLMRDLLRRLQLNRKEIGLEIEDRISLIWHSENKTIHKLFQIWSNFIADELLATVQQSNTALENTIELGTDTLSFLITKR